MIHGTGLYWNPIYKANYQKDEYVVSVKRLYNYYYPQMSDCYEPTYEALNEYDISVIKWRVDRWGDKVADHISEGYRTGSIDLETCKKIWWCLKNRDIPFEAVHQYFIQVAGREIRL